MRKVVAATTWVAVVTVAACQFDTAGVAPADDPDASGERQPVDAGVTEPADAAVVVTVDAAVDAATVPPPPDAGPPPPDAGDGDDCPTGYGPILGTGGCYRATEDKKSWLAAEQACEAEGAHLAVLDSEAEYGALQIALSGQRWVGFSDRVHEDLFPAVTGEDIEALPFIWKVGEPNDGGDGPGGKPEDCVELAEAGLNDDHCEIVQRYVCEHDGDEADPSAY
jgi:hypothetical protein